MKKTKGLLLLLLIALLVTACGGGDADNGNGQEPPKIEGEVIQKESFSIFVPKGWFVTPVSEEKADEIQLHKYARDELSAMNRPGIRITYFGPESTNYPPPRDLYDEVVDLESQPIGALTWEGYSCEMAGSPMMVLWVEGDGAPILMQAALWLELGGKTIAFEDEDVTAIFESITIL